MNDLERLVRAGTSFAQPQSLEDLCLRAVRVARELTGASYSSIGLVEGDIIHWQSAAGKPIDEVRGYKQPIASGLCGWVACNARACRTGDVTAEPDYFLQYSEMRSELDVPIKNAERVIGVLSAESPEPDAFSADDEAHLQILACYVAIALAHGVGE
jgi:putative methionine-R-sulfoxide reductase with GAF domain